MTPHSTLTRYAWLSIGAALVTMAIKAAAYFVTGSVAFLSDAIESTVNLGAAIVALVALSVRARPPDEDHAYGHGKVEYFSSGVEGTLILVAAIVICVEAGRRFVQPQPIEQPGLGILIALAAAGINLGGAVVLGRVRRSAATSAWPSSWGGSGEGNARSRSKPMPSTCFRTSPRRWRSPSASGRCWSPAG